MYRHWFGQDNVAMAQIQLLDAVALLEDLPQQRLQRGQVGTLVEILAPGVYEEGIS